MKTNQDAIILLPEGIKLRKHQFGSNPFSELVAVPSETNKGGTDCRREFKIHWHDSQLGLTIEICERDDNGHLIASVHAVDADLHMKGAVSVALVGTNEDALIRKTIPLDTISGQSCSGSADFGPLSEATKTLGEKLGIVAFLLV